MKKFVCLIFVSLMMVAAPANAWTPSETAGFKSSVCGTYGKASVTFVRVSLDNTASDNAGWFYLRWQKDNGPVQSKTVGIDPHSKTTKRIHLLTGSKVRVNVWAGFDSQGVLLLDATRKSLLCDITK